MSLVQAVAVQTLAGNTDKAVLSKLEDRIASLSRAHDVILNEQLRAGRIRDVVEAIAPLEALQQRVSVEGPNIRLGAATVITLSMLLHELATNALKHGALSGKDGRIALTWKIDSATADASFVLEWAESGGPPVLQPTRIGLGSRLVRAGQQRRPQRRELRAPRVQGDLPFENGRSGAAAIARITINRVSLVRHCQSSRTRNTPRDNPNRSYARRPSSHNCAPCRTYASLVRGVTTHRATTKTNAEATP